MANVVCHNLEMQNPNDASSTVCKTLYAELMSLRGRHGAVNFLVHAELESDLCCEVPSVSSELFIALGQVGDDVPFLLGCYQELLNGLEELFARATSRQQGFIGAVAVTIRMTGEDGCSLFHVKIGSHGFFLCVVLSSPPGGLRGFYLGTIVVLLRLPFEWVIRLFFSILRQLL